MLMPEFEASEMEPMTARLRIESQSANASRSHQKGVVRAYEVFVPPTIVSGMSEPSGP